MAKIIQETPNPAHGTIDLIVEDAFGNISHHSIHIGSAKPCPDCGHLQMHAGISAEESVQSKANLLAWIDSLDVAKITAFEAHGFDMSKAKAYRFSMAEIMEPGIDNDPSS